jgi:hypothetical protein
MEEGCCDQCEQDVLNKKEVNEHILKMHWLLLNYNFSIN